jgi:hypothetical protein
MSKLHFSKIDSFDDENDDLKSFQPLKKKVSNNKSSDKSDKSDKFDKNKSDNDGFNEINSKNKKKFSK